MKLRLLILGISFISQAAFASVEWIPGHGNAGHTGYYDMQTNPANYHLLWTKKMGLNGDEYGNQLMSGVVVADNKLVYELSERDPNYKLSAYVVALDLESGNLQWRANHDCLFMDISYSMGMIIYNAQYCSYRIGAFDIANGRLLYSDVIPEPIGDLIPYGDTVYYDNSNNNSYVAYNPKNTKVIWENKDDSRTSIANVGVNNNYVVTQPLGYGKLSVISRLKGDTLMTIEVSGNSDFWSSPTMHDQGNVVYFKTRETNPSSNERPWSSLHAFDIGQRIEQWKVNMQDVYSFPVLTKDHVYSINYLDNQILAINILNGKIDWTWTPPADDPVLETFYSQMVATNDVIFANSAKRIYAVSLATHKTVWQLDLSAARKRLALSNGKLIVTGMETNNRGHDSDVLYVYALK